jgi:hypothetical protein
LRKDIWLHREDRADSKEDDDAAMTSNVYALEARSGHIIEVTFG